MAFIQENVSEIGKLVDGDVVYIAPGECLLEALFAIVGVVTRIDPVRDDEKLDILEERTAGRHSCDGGSG